MHPESDAKMSNEVKRTGRVPRTRMYPHMQFNFINAVPILAYSIQALFGKEATVLNRCIEEREGFSPNHNEVG